MINLEDYKVIVKKDCNDSDLIYGFILLNKKHTVEEFQKEIYRAKKEAREEIDMFGDDWYYITAHINKDFDFNDYVEF